PESHPLSLHDALPISSSSVEPSWAALRIVDRSCWDSGRLALYLPKLLRRCRSAVVAGTWSGRGAGSRRGVVVAAGGSARALARSVVPGSSQGESRISLWTCNTWGKRTTWRDRSDSKALTEGRPTGTPPGRGLLPAQGRGKAASTLSSSGSNPKRSFRAGSSNQ